MRFRNYAPRMRRAACVVSSLALIVAHTAHAGPADSIFSDSWEIDTSCHDTITLPDGSQRSQITRSDITYGIYSGSRPNSDVTKWESIWGSASLTGSVTLWPGPGAASPVIRDFDRDGYVAAKFHVPAGFLPAHFGQYVHAINPPGPPIRVSYSQICGDFNPAPGVGCGIVEEWPDDLSTGLQWKLESTNPNFCALQADTDYYLNITLVDPLTTDQCPIGDMQCQVYLQHTHN